jgi:hypothetical protein
VLRAENVLEPPIFPELFRDGLASPLVHPRNGNLEEGRDAVSGLELGERFDSILLNARVKLDFPHQCIGLSFPACHLFDTPSMRVHRRTGMEKPKSVSESRLGCSDPGEQLPKMRHASD